MILSLTSIPSLEKYIIYKQRHISEDIVLKIFYELVLGLKDIHEANLAHLDIKPSNILIDDEGSIKISDFGISIRTPVDAKWIKGEGDRTYMAPDLLREEFDKPADIFSLGLVILELATGLVLPETDEPWESLRLGDFSNQDAALSRLSPDLEKLIRWLLITDSADRPTVHDIIKSSYFKSIETSDANEIGTADIMKYVNEVRRLAIEEATRLEHQNIYSTPEHKGSKLPLFSIPL
ncbi:kinase-like domain-containing protein [Pilobolus umbonatus]|nr:kinase-like domain-containing protein [Pilobolus umbonatus]